jgi:uncharacterized protein YecT (DUF1311 family)
MAGSVVLLLWAETGMRAIVLAIVALQVMLGDPARAQTASSSDQPISEMLPLFGRNHCGDIKDAAEQLFCGDPELNDVAVKLTTAIQHRLDRIPDRRHAIEENVRWIKNRNSSCGIFGRQSVPARDLKSVTACLLLETEERIAILVDENFDCLATNTTAGTLICSDPSLALAETDLNAHLHALFAKLKENEARDAFVEYARWTRVRDRKCDLVGKDNVPLEELSTSEDCLAEFMSKKTAEIVAAKGDPKRIFGRHQTSPSPDADAVDLCVTQIHAANNCDNFLRVSRVFQGNTEVSAQEARVMAEVEMVVLSPFADCSPVALSCTGTCWDLRAGKARATPGSRDSFSVAYRLKVQKAFAFQKADASSWRCNSAALPPVEVGSASGAGP